MGVLPKATLDAPSAPDAAPDYFSLPELDRLSDSRSDRAWLDRQLASPDTLLVPVWRERNLFASASVVAPELVPAPKVRAALTGAESITLLGRLHDRLHFALGLASADDRPPAWAAGRGVFRDLRDVAPLIGRVEGALLAYARAMVYWHRRHRYCGDCGWPTESSDAGHLRDCTNPACSQQHFPRTDPAVIALVTSGGRCLFGRKQSWPTGMYSIIAGFVEPGESLEAAVSREVLEETGLHVEEIAYQSSQPWPFPSSLMIGFTARAASGQIRLNDCELEDVRWMSRSAVVRSLQEGAFRLPMRTSISFRLISQWFDAGEMGPLERVLESIGVAA
jgi:NAD+ diphosphatase